MDRPLGVILAGGQARRMGGGDKGLLRLDERSILDHVIERLSPQVDAIGLNANGDRTRFADTGLPVFQDSIDGFPGPLAGVLAGMDWAHDQGASMIVTIAADTPFFPGDLVARLMSQYSEANPIVLAATRDEAGKLWRHPTFGLWTVSLRDDLRKALGDGLRKVVLWTDQHGATEAEFETTPIDPFFNVNTPDDLVEARRLLETA
ncbi:molybdenum cofactor guanylyltransferase MobA [Cognatishimia activa]|uniref:Molybdenum cofactor guanylyltransferase n=1 Tax=Cognatishimia activa TaxID=1715691 RepID=A0A0P1IYD2_9RHOB|nr:molybdenum cofactor guanylyltransferase MobA [Cognatishimia activa]CUJ04107.1 Molybdenum cofactor guanylyltransferase [Cognatishimia activa]CUK26084.1 Molybdenum cofactor guanylyltransferase [Cognatishimia activa]